MELQPVWGVDIDPEDIGENDNEKDKDYKI